MKNILFPTDFSDCAANALEHACRIALHFRSSITLLHVYPIPIAASDVPTELIIASQFKEDAEKGMAAIKAHAVQAYPTLSFQTIVTAGDASSEISYYLKENPCDIVIMGTSGASGLKRLAVGSTATHVIQHAHIPVMVIPSHRHYQEIKHIVISSSFNLNEVEYIKNVYEWYKAFNCKLSLLRIDDVTTFQDDVTAEQVEAFMLKVKQALNGVEPSVVVVSGTDVPHSIIDFVRHSQVDLLVTVHQHRSFIAQLIFPSISKDIAFHPPAPLLIFNRYKK